MLDVRAVVKFWQHAQKTEAANRGPAPEFDESVGGIGLRGDEHGAAGVFAVVEGEKETAALVPSFVAVATQGKGAAAELHYAQENSEKIAEGTERLKAAIGQRCHIGGKSNT